MNILKRAPSLCGARFKTGATCHARHVATLNMDSGLCRRQGSRFHVKIYSRITEVEETTTVAAPMEEVSTPAATQVESSGMRQFLQGNAYLLAVAMLWGSYTPVLKILFNLEDGPTPELVAWIRGVLQATILGSILLSSNYLAKANSDDASPGGHTTQIGSFEVPTVLVGALEIGFYNCGATLLQTEGISMSGAIRAAFLIQATALWTPLLSTLLGERPALWQWVGSFIALCSALIVTLDQKMGGGGQAVLDSGGFPNTGDLYILGATVSYSLATVRIPSYAKNLSPLELAVGKSSVLALVASALLLYEIPQGGSIASLWPAYQEQMSAWGCLLWAAVFCGALTAFLHVKGQSLVSATEAQLVFSTVPLWSAIIAAIILPNEHLGPLTWLGGAMMIVAGLVSSKSKTQ